VAEKITYRGIEYRVYDRGEADGLGVSYYKPDDFFDVSVGCMLHNPYIDTVEPVLAMWTTPVYVYYKLPSGKIACYLKYDKFSGRIKGVYCYRLKFRYYDESSVSRRKRFNRFQERLYHRQKTGTFNNASVNNPSDDRITRFVWMYVLCWDEVIAFKQTFPEFMFMKERDIKMMAADMIKREDVTLEITERVKKMLGDNALSLSDVIKKIERGFELAEEKNNASAYFAGIKMLLELHGVKSVENKGTSRRKIRQVQRPDGILETTETREVEIVRGSTENMSQLQKDTDAYTSSGEAYEVVSGVSSILETKERGGLENEEGCDAADGQ